MNSVIVILNNIVYNPAITTSFNNSGNYLPKSNYCFIINCLILFPVYLIQLIVKAIMQSFY